MTNLCLPSLFYDSKKPGLLRALVFSLLGMGWYAFIYDLEDADGRRIPEHYDEPYRVTGSLAKTKWDNTFLHCIEIDKFRMIYTQKSRMNAACVSKKR